MNIAFCFSTGSSKEWLCFLNVNMSKTIIYGTGGVGANLARRIVAAGGSVHLAGRNEETVRGLSTELACSFTVGDVGDSSFLAK